MQLKDKVAIVTGAARGLGRAYAEALAKEGAAVVAGDVRDCADTVKAIRDAGGRALGVALDVAKLDSCKATADAAVKEFGRVDALVNNAALYANLKGGRFDQLDESQWDQVMQVNIKGVWNACRAVVPLMRAQKSGSVINISSLAPVYGLPYALDYSMSKGAVIAMTRSLARELGRDWVRVNAVAPSAVMTEGTKEFFGEKLDKAKQVIAQGQSLQRNLETGDLTGTIVYLVSDASKFVTGQTIMVDGGTVFL
ncbi:MAG TPA: glucose 1-dehydrogenase [Burkholderiales bacterium]|jgi:3-oxoacyl-[acyl-carrier protein] reductase|nr:glucose 1-dehydrogenase [Burkholderiales bacterium]